MDERWKFYTLVVEEYGTGELIREGKTWLSQHEKDETSVDLQRPFDLVYLV